MMFTKSFFTLHISNRVLTLIFICTRQWTWNHLEQWSNVKLIFDDCKYLASLGPCELWKILLLSEVEATDTGWDIFQGTGLCHSRIKWERPTFFGQIIRKDRLDRFRSCQSFCPAVYLLYERLSKACQQLELGPLSSSQISLLLEFS